MLFRARGERELLEIGWVSTTDVYPLISKEMIIWSISGNSPQAARLSVFMHE
jgi:hypothetical protein